MRTSRVSEAVEHLQEMHERAAAYYQKPQRLASGRMSSRCLPPPAGPVPAEPQAQPQAVDWRHAALPGQTTWQSLGFQPAEPLRYAYEFLPRSYGCELRKPASGPLLTLRAHGDLDGDGRLSTLERHANPQDDSTLAPYGVLWIDQRIE